MRVLYLNPSGQLGGAERSLLDILASLRAAVPDWSLGLITSSAGPLTENAAQLGVTVRVVPFPPALARLGDAALKRTQNAGRRHLTLVKNLLWAAPEVMLYRRKLRAAMTEFAPQIVHSNGFKMHVLAAQTAPRRVPVIWHIRDYVGRRAVMARLLRWHAGRCALIIANSQSAAEDVRRVCGDTVKRLETIYNAIDTQEFTPAGAVLSLDASTSLPPAPAGTVRVGLPGTLARWKGHATFLEALALLPSSTNMRGYVIGGALYETDGSQLSLAELKQMAQQLGLRDKVGFTGFIREPAAALRALDIVVHASIAPEPFGRVIVEGMACGRAVIASRAGGAQELFTEGVDALGHEPGDARELAERIHNLACDKDLRTRLGHAGRRTAEQRFDRRRLADELLPLYQSLKRTAATKL